MTSRVEGSVGSGGLGERFEGDLVAEAFELFDESSAVAFGVLGVAAVEELLARGSRRAVEFHRMAGLLRTPRSPAAGCRVELLR
jgi:hypothetical protein